MLYFSIETMKPRWFDEYKTVNCIDIPFHVLKKQHLYNLL